MRYLQHHSQSQKSRIFEMALEGGFFVPLPL